MRNPQLQSGRARRLLEETALAIGLLTRFPLPAFEIRSTATIASAFWAFPLAGAAVGFAGAAAFWLASALNLGAAVAAILAIAAALIATGALHEDGLADFWDGLGGGATREARLDIMWDSRIGVYGALALVAALGLQAALLLRIYEGAGLGGALPALVAAEAAARAAIALPAGLLPPARADGFGRTMTGLNPAAWIFGVLIGCALSVVWLGGAGLAVIAGVAAGAAAVTALARRYLGGYTGDVLGAAVVMARLCGLGAAAMAMTS